MVRISLALGITAALAGLAAIGFGVPIQAFGLGNTLIIAGSTVFSAGLVVITLALMMRLIEHAVQDLRQPVVVEPSAHRSESDHPSVTLPPPLMEPHAGAPPHEEFAPAERAEAGHGPMTARSGWQDDGADEALRPGMRPPGAPPPPPAPAASAAPTREPMRAPHLEREASIRSRLPGRAERFGQPRREPAGEHAQPVPEKERRLGPVAPAGEPRDERESRVSPYAPQEKRRGFSWTRRNKDRSDEAASDGGPEAEPEFGAPPSARAPQAPAESRDMPRLPLRGARLSEPRERHTVSPASAAAPPPPPREHPAPTPPTSEPEPHPAPAPNAEEEAQAVEVLKQGTVDGMSYTLYTDGSIDAEFPDGKIRFNSIDELRQHLEAQQD